MFDALKIKNHTIDRCYVNFAEILQELKKSKCNQNDIKFNNHCSEIQ